MQPPPSDVPPPPPPPPPPGQPVAVGIGNAQLPLQGAPQTVQEVRGLEERLDILRNQLDRANGRRNELVEELSPREGQPPPPPEARTGIQQRLTVMDEQILQIERDIALTERLRSNTSLRLLGEAVQQERREQNRVDEDEAMAAGFAAFGGGILLTLIVARLRRRFSRRRAVATQKAMLEDPRIDRLAHAVDAIAEEVERIGEGQRFVTQLLAQRHEAPVLRGEALGAEAERR